MSITNLRWRVASALIAAGATAAVLGLAAPAGAATGTAQMSAEQAGYAAIGSARAARAAAVPGWRTEHLFGPGESAGARAVTATSASNAWATGSWSRNGNNTYLMIAHWDGTKWSILRSPAGYAGDTGDAVATLSASYAWAFVHDGSVPRSSAPDSALLWQNGTWRAFPLAGGVVMNSAVAFTQSNAWGFGERYRSTGPAAAYAVHFNGQRWSAVTIPVLPQGTTSLAPDNIWAVGPLASATGQPIPQPYALAHWTGSTWQTVPFPDLHLPTGEGVTRAWVVSDDAQGVWVAGDVRNKSFSKVGGVLLHWTGSSWVNVAIPFQTAGLGPLSHDGQGGLWINNCPSPGGDCYSLDMAHYNSAGQWSLTPVSLPAATGATATAMRLIPGTNSVWASAIFEANNTFSGGMLKYGP